MGEGATPFDRPTASGTKNGNNKEQPKPKQQEILKVLATHSASESYSPDHYLWGQAIVWLNPLARQRSSMARQLNPLATTNNPLAADG